jgi:hypothetical protein
MAIYSPINVRLTCLSVNQLIDINKALCFQAIAATVTLPLCWYFKPGVCRDRSFKWQTYQLALKLHFEMQLTI